MQQIAELEQLFFDRHACDKQQVSSIITPALHKADDGELFLEYTESESLVFDDGRLRNANFNTASGFGLRAVNGEAVAYAHASEISADALKRAVTTVSAMGSETATQALETSSASSSLYTADNPLHGQAFNEKVALLSSIDQYVRQKEPLTRQVSISLAGEWQAVYIMRPDGLSLGDIRPLVRLNISVVLEKDGRMESGSYGVGGRQAYTDYIDPARWQKQADEALRQAHVNLESVPAPAGEMQVVLGPGWPGILLHEAVGHGLEGDFNRKKTSVFSELMGTQVAAKGVTVIDDGTIADRRGSITIDDEGTPSQKTTLIEDGILCGYMQDRLNARLMGVKPTGNGRRESYAHTPMPRMTNTYMLGGQDDPEEILSSVKDGLYAVNFGGGQVDITSGKFVFSASEAYRIENGKISHPVKGATLIGSGLETLKRITAIGNDMALDPGIGTCGKAGQGVPVGVGQPTLLLEDMTVGGTDLG